MRGAEIHAPYKIVAGEHSGDNECEAYSDQTNSLEKCPNENRLLQKARKVR